jgi:hypothetical protein
VLQSVVVVVVHSPCMCEQLEIPGLNDRVTGVGWLVGWLVGCFQRAISKSF